MNNALWFDYKTNVILNPEKNTAAPFLNAALALQVKAGLILGPIEHYQTMH